MILLCFFVLCKMFFYQKFYVKWLSAYNFVDGRRSYFVGSSNFVCWLVMVILDSFFFFLANDLIRSI